MRVVPKGHKANYNIKKKPLDLFYSSVQNNKYFYWNDNILK